MDWPPVVPVTVAVKAAVAPTRTVAVPGEMETVTTGVLVTVTATTRSGEHQRFVGRYVVRRAVVDGATPAQRSWHIDSATMRAASV